MEIIFNFWFSITDFYNSFERNVIMKNRFFTQLTLIIAVLALTAVSEEKPLSLADTKWKLEAFVDLETNEIREPNRSYNDEEWPSGWPPLISAENRFTVEFSSDPGYPSGLYYSGNLVSAGFGGDPSFNVDYANSTIAFGRPISIDGPMGGIPDESKYYWALVGAQTFELTDTTLKIYYLARSIDYETWEEIWSDKPVGYLLFKPRVSSSKIQDADLIARQPLSSYGIEAKAAVLPPEIILSASDLAAGPNPVAKSAGLVNFYRVGKQVKSASLKIYDASGKAVAKISISDKSADRSQSKRQVGSWNLKDSKGRPVSEGAYLVRGTIKTVDGKSERIALVISVR